MSRPQGGGVEANNQQRQVKGARLLGPKQYQVKRYAQDDKVDDILPSEPVYQQHISHCWWHDSLHLETDCISKRSGWI
jgi:hypothetical protein